MLTPLQCIVSHSKSLGGKLKHSEAGLAKSAELICLTSKLLLALTNDSIKLSLTGKFEVKADLCPLNRIVGDVVEIMRPITKIEIAF